VTRPGAVTTPWPVTTVTLFFFISIATPSTSSLTIWLFALHHPAEL